MNHQPSAPPQHVHPLTTISEVSDTIRAKLKPFWIESAEQVIAAAATPAGRAGLQRLLEIDEQGLAILLQLLSQSVGDGAAQHLSHPAPGGVMGLVLTEEQRAKLPPTV